MRQGYKIKVNENENEFHTTYSGAVLSCKRRGIPVERIQEVVKTAEVRSIETAPKAPTRHYTEL